MGSSPIFLCILVGCSERGGKLPAKKLQDLLQAILRDDLDVEPSYYIAKVRTFQEAGVPTEKKASWSRGRMAPSTKSRSTRASERLERLW
jgi:hypothetical protein